MSYYMLTEGTVTQAAAGLGMIPKAGAYRDGLFSALGQPKSGAIRDGIFTSFGAGESVALDLKDKDVLEQFKLALRSMTNLSSEDTDAPYWTTETEQAFNQWLAFMATQPVDVKQLYTTVGGKAVPTALGAEWVIKTAVALYDKTDPAKGQAYAKQYWPALTTWNEAAVAQRSYSPPSVTAPEEDKGMQYAMIAGGVGVAAVALYLIFRK